MKNLLETLELTREEFQKGLEEFDNGEVSWNTRDDAENMIKSF